MSPAGAGQTFRLFEFLPSVNDSGSVELACHAEQLIHGTVVFASKSVATATVVTPPQPLPTLAVIVST
jgi:hypothetical protein